MTPIVSTRINQDKVIGIIMAEEYFKQYLDADSLPFFITKDDYVVAKWSELYDGDIFNIENVQTIAICKSVTDAKLIYQVNR